MSNKQLVIELKEIINNLKEYRILTNELINNHVSLYDINEFIDRNYIESTEEHFCDYDYDLYKWVNIAVLEEILVKLKVADDE